MFVCIFPLRSYQYEAYTMERASISSWNFKHLDILIYLCLLFSLWSGRWHQFLVSLCVKLLHIWLIIPTLNGEQQVIVYRLFESYSLTPPNISVLIEYSSPPPLFLVCASTWSELFFAASSIKMSHILKKEWTI